MHTELKRTASWSSPRRELAVSVVAGLIACAWATAATALDPATTDPKAILRAAFSTQPQRSLARLKMSIRDSGGARERVFSMRSQRTAEQSKMLMLIEAPGDVRGTGFLSISYPDGKRPDEQWIYLPKLRRVSRVADSGKSDSFVGSDFSMSDLALASQNLDEFQLKLLDPAAKVGNEECWQIESTPRTAAGKSETGYDRTQIWISKSKLTMLQFKGTVTGTTKTKYLKALDLRSVNGIWTPQRMQMRTLDGSAVASETLIEYLAVDNDAAEVKDTDFTQQRLEQGA